MTKSFLDTTVVINLAASDSPLKAASEAFVGRHQPSEVAYYSLRELLTGHVRYLCDAHNAILGSQDHSEALIAILGLPPTRGRHAAAMAIATSLKSGFFTVGSGSPGDFKREGLQALAIKVTQLWSRARKLKQNSYVQPLACYNDGKLSLGNSGELRGPNDSFNCRTQERCAAAAYIHDDAVAVSKLIDALHPGKLDERAKRKVENAQRRKVLKDLKKDGPIRFSKAKCRALGDAYFSVMCPHSSILATTNLEDYEPLCSALGKSIKKP